MAKTPVIDPDNREKQDELYNPSQRQWDDELEQKYKAPAISDDSRNTKKLKDQEDGVSAPDTSKDDGLEQKEEDAASTSIPYTPKNTTAKVKGKLTSKQKTAGGGLVGLILIAIFGISSISPFGMFIHVKELFTDHSGKFARTAHGRYNTRVQKQALFSNPDSCGRVAVKCRLMGGVSDKRIERLQRAGYQVETATTRDGSKKYVVSMKLIGKNGVELATINEQNYIQQHRTNPEVRAANEREVNSKASWWRGSVTLGVLDKFRINRKNPIGDGTDRDKIQQDFRKNIYAEDNTGGRVRPSGEEDDPNNPNSNLAELEGVDESAQDAANDIRENLAGSDYADGVPEHAVPDTSQLDGSSSDVGKVTSVLTGTVGGAGKGALFGPVLGAVDKSCTAYQMIRTVTFGAKIYKARALLRYSAIFMTMADSAKAGDITPEQASFIASIMVMPSRVEATKGKTFFDSPGWNLVTKGGSTSNASLARWTNGAPLLSFLQQAQREIDDKTGGNAAQVCRSVNSVWGQIGFGLLGIGQAIFTGGAAALAGAAVGAGMGATLSILAVYATPLIIQYLAGTSAPDPATDPEGGYGAGSAVYAGMGALGDQIGMAQAMRPLKKDDLPVIAAEASEESAMIAAAESINGSDSLFDMNNKQSPITKMAITLMPLTASIQAGSPNGTIGNILQIPQTAASSVSSALMPSAFAQSSNEYRGDLCADEDYAKMNLATDAACNLLRGEVNSIIDSAELEPGLVIDYMVNNEHINPETGNPISEEYSSFYTNCVNQQTMQPITSDGYGIDVSQGGIDTLQCLEQGQMYNYFRAYNWIDSSLKSTEETVNGTLGTSSGGGASAAVSQVASGDKQDLAKQILDSGKVTGDARYMDQIKAIAAGDNSCNLNVEVLRLIATMAQNHTLYLTSLNRYCTAVLTASGAASFHYRDGGGHALDIGLIDGVAATGATSKDITLINEILPLLKSGSGIGQSNCRSQAGNSINMPAGIRQFSDTCNHLHIEVPVQ